MAENRLTKKVFLWDKQLNDSNQITSWSSELKCIFRNSNPFNIKSTTTEMQQIFKIKQQNYLKAECEIKPKLRTFTKIKNFQEIPAYIVKPLTFVKRRSIGKTRLGSLQIRLETGRFSRPVLEEHLRICLVCDQVNHGGQQIEKNVNNLEQCEQLSIVLNHPENVKPTSQILISAFDMRSQIINQ